MFETAAVQKGALWGSGGRRKAAVPAAAYASVAGTTLARQSLGRPAGAVVQKALMY